MLKTRLVPEQIQQRNFQTAPPTKKSMTRTWVSFLSNPKKDRELMEKRAEMVWSLQTCETSEAKCKNEQRL
jgi:hypothetical protein